MLDAVVILTILLPIVIINWIPMEISVFYKLITIIKKVILTTNNNNFNKRTPKLIII